MLLEFNAEIFVAGIFLLVIVLIIQGLRKRSLGYLLCLTVFWLYLLGIVKEAIFPIHIPDAASVGQELFLPSINLIPLYYRCSLINFCLREIFGNILLTVPFGFGVCFIARCKARDFFWLAPAVGLTLESIQLILSLAFRSSFRAVDINDVLLNALGVGLGYGLFRVFAWLYRRSIHRYGRKPKGLLLYVYEVACSASVKTVRLRN